MEKSKNKKKTLIALVALVIFIKTSFILYLVYSNSFGKPEIPKSDQQVKEEPLKEEPFFKDSVNILVVGIDQRGKEKSRTDTIMVYRLNPKEKTVKLFSIPRDTYVEIPGHGMDKINHAHSFGEMKLTIETVEKFLGIKIDHYVRLDFEGFRKLIDLVGGVTIDVEKNIIRDDVKIKKGVQYLNSEQALVYVRDRWDPMGDIERVKRQQKFIRALAKEVVSFEPKWKLVTTMPSLYKSLSTDIPLKVGEEAIDLFKDINMDTTEFERVPGWFYNKNGISYWKPNLDETQEIVKKVFKDELPVSKSVSQ